MRWLALVLLAGCTLNSQTRDGEIPDGHWGWHDPDRDGRTLGDRCPTEAAPEAAGDGCPDFDADDDGIPDERDACPSLAESDALDGSYDGCPGQVRPDDDADGVANLDDACPHAAEDGVGGAAADGCPALLASD